MTDTLSLTQAFDLYEKARRFMPTAEFPANVIEISGLVEIADRFDVAVLDSFGVLNIGEGAIPGVAETVEALRQLGKHIIVLTNGATLDQPGAVAKVKGFGFDIDSDDVISSRSALKFGLQPFDRHMLWGIAAPAHSNCHTLDIEFEYLGDSPEIYSDADGFILLSTHDWPPRHHRFLQDALAAKMRPVLVGNPDLVAPRGSYMSIEPGYFAWMLHETTGVEPQNFGKPHQQVFEQARQRIQHVLGTVDPTRVLMVGDSLHTDILGGAAAGFTTVLTTQDGFFAGADPHKYFESCGIRPNYMLPRI